MARRDTEIAIYKTGRIDPTYTNIWAFESRTQRSAWLGGKSPKYYTGCKYWRVGASIKLDVTYEDSFGYDYARITNKGGDKNYDYYCFITGRQYISDTVTMFILDVDIVQTYYFTTSIDGGEEPFWQVQGLVTTDLSDDLPPRGTTSEFPTGIPYSNSFIYEPKDYKVVIFSSVDPSELPTVTYKSLSSGEAFMATPPYLLDLNGSILSDYIGRYNEAGVTSTISGIYLVPSSFFPGQSFTTPTFPSNAYYERDIYVNSIADCGSYTPKNNVLLGYDYTYFTINTGQGETALYHFEDFDGEPHFVERLTFNSGAPTLIIYPVNYKADSGSEQLQRAMKITQAPSCSWLNDNYSIWLAQTQNSRAVAIDGANLAIDQAYEAKRESFSANVDNIVSGISKGINTYTSGKAAVAASNVAQEYTNFASNGFVWGTIGRSLQYAGNTALDALSSAANKVGSLFGANLNLETNRRAQTPAAQIAVGADRTAEIQENTGLSSGDTTAFLRAGVNKLLGIEQAYVYDQRIANAIQSYNQLVAGYRDKAAIPQTAVGSNAYGDLTSMAQYGFMITVFSPTAEMAELIDDALSASGHTVNKYKIVNKLHQVFDVLAVASPYIPVQPDVRPEYARRMLLQILSNGAYLWYVYNGDISDRIGCPYKLDNPKV